MKKHFTPKKILVSLLILLLVAQFFRIDKTNLEINLAKDFVTITSAPVEVQTILQTSCYDCHSNNVVYPWYSNIAPFSWWLKHHVNEGRSHLNFSEWGNYTAKKANHKLEECVEMVEEDKMPMNSYTIMHSNAKLNDAQKKLLINWFNSLRKSVEEKELEKE